MKTKHITILSLGFLLTLSKFVLPIKMPSLANGTVLSMAAAPPSRLWKMAR